MDVTCNRCSTVYEFEEGLISTTGTTVKCTQCGHLFKVRRSMASIASTVEKAIDEGPRKWRVRRVDGSTHSLDSLVELSGLITAGQFQRDDEISRSGHVWKRLGEIAELSALFEAPMRARRVSEPPPEPRLDTSAAREAPAGARAAEPAAAPAPANVERSRRRSPQDQRLDEEPIEVEVEVDLEAGTQPMQPIIDRRTVKEPQEKPGERDQAATDLLEDEHTLPGGPAPARKARALLWSFLIGVPLIAGAVAGALFVLAREPQPHQDPVPEVLRHADRALASHRAARFDDAIRAYEQALAFHRDDPHILSSISRVYAIWSQELRFRERDLNAAARPETDPQSAIARAEGRRLADQAKHYSERAAQRNPGNEEAGVALSDALRLSGNLVAARAELDRARATKGALDGETLRVAALLAIDEADGDLSAGQALAERAVAQEPSSLRNRALLVRCLIAGGDLADARQQLAALGKLDPEHPVLAEIAAELTLADPPKPAKATGTQPTRNAPEPEPTPSGSTPASEPEPAKVEPSGAQAIKDPIELTRLGEAALERGAVQTAERDFQHALELDPRSARARTGLGYVALERGQPELAAAHFKPAARDGRAEALIGLGDAYRRLGRIRDAFDAYQTYLRRYPNGTRSSIARRQTELLSEQLGDGAR